MQQPGPPRQLRLVLSSRGHSLPSLTTNEVSHIDSPESNPAQSIAPTPAGAGKSQGSKRRAFELTTRGSVAAGRYCPPAAGHTATEPPRPTLGQLFIKFGRAHRSHLSYSITTPVLLPETTNHRDLCKKPLTPSFNLFSTMYRSYLYIGGLDRSCEKYASRVLLLWRIVVPK